MQEGQDVTVREATISALEQSEAGFAKMKENFHAVSDAFDAGKDMDGLQLIQEKVIPHIKSFCGFCITIIDTFGGVLSDDVRTELEKKICSMDKLINKLMEETGKANFTEVGDLLRYDFCDLVTEFSALFEKIRACFKNSKSKELDSY